MENPRPSRFAGLRRLTLAAVAMTAFATQPVLSQAQPEHKHKHVGHNLRMMVERYHSLKAERRGLRQSEPNVRSLTSSAASNEEGQPIQGLQYDDQNRVLVVIRLNGTMSMSDMHALVEAQGGSVVGEDPYYRKGAMSAYVPMAAVDDISDSGAVMSMEVSPAPLTNSGATTAQGLYVHHADILNAAGIDGTGITVGLMSDSFDKAPKCPVSSGNCVTKKAADDVASGDLPIMKYVKDDTTVRTDEGRAMTQIVHDIAPNAGLCFATAEGGEPAFAANIRDLRTNPLCQADVIVDDIIYFFEPMFSDGEVAQAVNDVSTSTTLPGKKISYFSSAGNAARTGYSSPWKPVTNAAGRALPNGLNWATVPATCAAGGGTPIDTTGGFHNFGTTANPDITMTLTNAANAILIMQWDDPWDIAGGVTTDYGLLIFNGTTGNYAGCLDDNNFTLQEPVEAWQLGAGTNRRFVIYRHGGGSPQSKYLKQVWFNATVSSPVFTADQAVTYGHNSAAYANGVAAYFYTTLPQNPPGHYEPLFETFSSAGPVIITHDVNGNRLPFAETRKKPDMAAVDGENTTFFPSVFQGGTDFEASYPGAADGFPNFFGTSAAAPTAGAVAALMIQKAGGPGSLAPAQVTSYLQTSAPARDTDKFRSSGTITIGSAKVSLVANGIANNDANFFTLTFTSTVPGQTLDSLTIDLTGTDIVFNNSVADGGNPLVVGSSNGPTITNMVPAGNQPSVTLTFSGFTTGKQITFGLGRRFVVFNGASRSRFADLLGGGAMSATLSGPVSGSSSINNNVIKGYSIYDGFGLIDAQAAVNKIP